MSLKERKATKRDRGYGDKKHSGTEIHHRRHPKEGIPWCDRCVKEGRC